MLSLKWLQSYQRVPLEPEKEHTMRNSRSNRDWTNSAVEEYNESNERWYYLRQSAVLHVAFLSLHLAIWWTAYEILSARSCSAPRVIYSPASNAVEYINHVYNDSGPASYYVQPPSPEIDQRWHDLILGNFVRLSADDLKEVGRLDNDPVLLEDGTGVGLINAHHEIHCVMSLYHASHPEYYWANATAEQQRDSRHHVDHCLDYLLQASMCHGDVGFMTYHWHMDQLEPYWRSAQHSCVNWEGLKDWMKDRKVPIHDPGFLVHPRLGVVYPEGAGIVPTPGKDDSHE